MPYCDACKTNPAGIAAGEQFCNWCGIRLNLKPPVPRGEEVLFGDYIVLDEISNSRGVRVVKARHRVLDRIVVLRILPVKTPDADALPRPFQQVAARLTAFEDTRVAQVYEVSRTHKGIYMVTQWVKGTNVRSHIRASQPVTIENAVQCIQQIAAGMHEAHRQGICHWNLHPGNLVITQNRRISVLDVGLHQLMANEQIVVNGSVTKQVGRGDYSPYIAPELHNSPSQADCRADVFSLGLVLSSLLTGKTPLEHAGHESGASGLPKFVLQAVVGSPDISSGLQHIIQDMTALDPRLRMQTMGSVHEALESLRDRTPTKHTKPTRPAEPMPPRQPRSEQAMRESMASSTRTTSPKPRGQLREGEVLKLPRWVPESPWWIVACVASGIFLLFGILLLVIGFHGYWTAQRNGPQTKPIEAPTAETASHDALGTTHHDSHNQRRPQSPDCQVARTVLWHGGCVTVIHENDEKVITWVEDLPYDEFYLSSIDFSNQPEPPTEATLAALGELTRIRSLNFENTPVGDEHLFYLNRLNGLGELNLRGTMVTDQAIESLALFWSLNELDLSETKFTAPGIEQLRQRIPDCYIHWSQPDFRGRNDPSIPNGPPARTWND